VVNTLEERAFLSPFVVRNVEVVGPRVGQQLRRQALLATALALAGILVYIGARFRQWVYGTAAVVAVFHDVLVTVGFLSLLNHEFNLNIVAALLTLMAAAAAGAVCQYRQQEHQPDPEPHCAHIGVDIPYRTGVILSWR
jgi:preprotein translocase SecF subunit